MYPYMNEDVMFERLKDLQREVENSYLIARSAPRLGRLARILGERIWLVAGLAIRRAPRRRPIAAHESFEKAAATDAA
jgi:hypothetical protein